MVAMVVGIQDGHELQFFTAQVVQDGQGIAWIDYGGMAMVADHPDVVIGECTDRNNARQGHVNKLSSSMYCLNQSISWDSMR
jgi:hypothetical protein